MDDENENVLHNYDSSQSKMMTENCITVDINDTVTGFSSKFDCHHKDGILHRAFSVILFDEKNRILIQKRSSDKITFPSIWANTCCSHPLDIDGDLDDFDMVLVNAAKRKLNQELGISKEDCELLSFQNIGKLEYSCRWNEDWIEREIDYVLIAKGEPHINPNINEISEYRWINFYELNTIFNGEKNIGVIAPWFKLIFENFIKPNQMNYENLCKIKSLDIVRCGEVEIERDSERPGNRLMESISSKREIVESEIMESLSKMSQERLHGAMTHLFRGGGKRLRAILPRLVGEAVGNPNDCHYTLGASIEIIHNFTLVHDDIIDQDPIRRGLDAVHVAYDDSTAINAGDAMLAVGFEILAESKDIPDNNLRHLIMSIGEMVRKVAEGQQEDIEFEDREVVTEEEYISMISGKTSAMFETCARTGAILANADTDTVNNMADWGLNLGICFQLMDDLIDITGDTETLGKPAGSDILQGKKTLVAIHALSSDNDLPIFNKIYGTGECSNDELSLAVKELEDSGSIEYAKERAMHHHKIAHRCLDELEQTEYVDVLRELTDFQLVRIN